MNKREVVTAVLKGERPPYVPWACAFSREARRKVCEHFGSNDLHAIIGNHVLYLNHVLTWGAVNTFDDLGDDRVRDLFGVVWNRRESKDLGVVEGVVLPKPTLSGYSLPDPCDPRFFQSIPSLLQRRGDCFRVFCISQSLYERASTLRGQENLMVDFYDHPDFVHELFDALSRWNCRLSAEAIARFPLDAVYFGDDWGQQRGLQMGPRLWREFIRPAFARMCRTVRDAGQFVFLHSCGNVAELFDDLIDLGVDCINPFQPEVMDVEQLLPRYRRRLTFHGGLSTQYTLPYGSPEQVRAETRRLLELGREGSYLFGPSNATIDDAPLENILAFLDEVQRQAGWSECSKPQP
jgi:uroporphyrinogen decarboxylase